MVDYTNPNRAFADVAASFSTESLAARKSFQLGQKFAEKQQKLRPNPAFEPLSNTPLIQDDPGLLDLGEASLYRAGGNLYDLGGDISNSLFGTNIDTTRDDGLSNPIFADQAAGVTTAYRDQVKQGQGQVLQDVKNDNYWDAAVNAVKIAPETLMDSAASFAELGVGSAATALTGGLAAPMMARRLKKMFDTGAEVKDQFDKLEKTADAGSLFGKGLSVAGREASKASVLTADIVQQQRQDFRAEHGRDPTALDTVNMIVLTGATTSFQPSIVKNLWLPGLPKLAKGKDTKEIFTKEMKNAVEYMDKGTIRKVAERVASGAGKVALAGGAEAVQEYAQTWAEILAVKAAPSTVENYLTGAFKAFQDQENIDETITAAFLGGAAGGTARGATAIPATAVGATGDVAFDTTKAVSGALARSANKKARAGLSAAESALVTENYKVEKAQHDELIKENTRKGESLSDVETFSSVLDEDIENDLIRNAKGQDLSDPDVFAKVKDHTLGQYTAEVKASRVGVEARRAAEVSSKAVTDVAKAAAAYVNITPEDVEKAVQAVKSSAIDVSDAVVEEIKNFRSSTTRGLAVMAIESGGEFTGKQLKAAQELARQMAPDAIRTAADTVQSHFPKAAKHFYRMADEKARDLENQGLAKDEIKNFKGLSGETKRAAQTTVREKEAVRFGNQIVQDAESTLEDLTTIETVEKALEAYTKTDLFTKQEDGAFSKERVAQLKDSLKKQRADLDNQRTEKIKKVVKKFAAEADDYAIKGAALAKKGTKAAIKGFDDLLDKFLSEDVGETVQDTVKDGRKLYGITRSAQGEAILATLRGQYNSIYEQKDDPNSPEAAKELLKGIMHENAIKGMADLFGTTDPDALTAVLKDSIPNLALDDEFKNRIKEVLKDVEQKPAAREKTVDKNAEPLDRAKGGRAFDKDDDNIEYFDQDLSNDDKTIAQVFKDTLLNMEPCK